MALSNVAFNDTVDLWRVRTNQMIIVLNGLELSNANSAYSAAGGAHLAANTAFAHANLARNFGNTTNAVAVSAYNFANTTNGVAVGAFAQANTAYVHANNAYNFANTVLVTTQAAFGNANTTLETASAAYAHSNAVNTTAISAFGQANTANTRAIAAFNNANTTLQTASAAFAHSNAVNITAISAFTQANTANGPTLTSKTLVDPIITGAIKEDVHTITDGVGFEIDPGNGSLQYILLGANRTPVATNFESGESVTLLVNDGTARTITWTSIGVSWVDNTAPTLATTGNTVIELWKVGPTMYGVHVGDVP